MRSLQVKLPTGGNIRASYRPNSTIRSIREELSRQTKRPESHLRLSFSNRGSRLGNLPNDTPLNSLGIKKDEYLELFFDPPKFSFQFGKTDPYQLPFNINATIRTAKTLIAPKYQVLLEDIVLKFNSVVFEDSMLLKDLPVPPGRSIQIDIKKKKDDRLWSYIFMIQHEAYRLELSKETTIKEVKRELMEKASNATINLKLMHDGIYLNDEDTISGVGIDPGSVIIVESELLTSNDYIEFNSPQISQRDVSISPEKLQMLENNDDDTMLSDMMVHGKTHSVRARSALLKKVKIVKNMGQHINSPKQNRPISHEALPDLVPPNNSNLTKDIKLKPENVLNGKENHQNGIQTLELRDKDYDKENDQPTTLELRPKDSDKESDKDSDKESDKENDKESDKENDQPTTLELRPKDSDKESDKDSDKDSDKESDKENDKESDKENDQPTTLELRPKESDKDSDKESDKENDKESDKENDKESDKENDQPTTLELRPKESDKDSDKESDKENDKESDKENDQPTTLELRPEDSDKENDQPTTLELRPEDSDKENDQPTTLELRHEDSDKENDQPTTLELRPEDSDKENDQPTTLELRPEDSDKENDQPTTLELRPEDSDKENDQPTTLELRPEDSDKENDQPTTLELRPEDSDKENDQPTTLELRPEDSDKENDQPTTLELRPKDSDKESDKENDKENDKESDKENDQPTTLEKNEDENE